MHLHIAYCSNTEKWRKKTAELVDIYVFILCTINLVFAPSWKQKYIKEKIMQTEDYYSKNITY